MIIEQRENQDENSRFDGTAIIKISRDSDLLETEKNHFLEEAENPAGERLIKVVFEYGSKLAAIPNVQGVLLEQHAEIGGIILGTQVIVNSFTRGVESSEAVRGVNKATKYLIDELDYNVALSYVACGDDFEGYIEDVVKARDLEAQNSESNPTKGGIRGLLNTNNESAPFLILKME